MLQSLVLSNPIFFSEHKAPMLWLPTLSTNNSVQFPRILNPPQLNTDNSAYILRILSLPLLNMDDIMQTALFLHPL